MANNNGPVELPPLHITDKPPQLPPLNMPPQVPRPTYQFWNEQILSPDAFGNLPFTDFTERYIQTMVVAMLDSTKYMQMAYDQARNAVAQNADQSLTDAGFKNSDASTSSLLGEVESDLALVRQLLSDTSAQIAQKYAKAGQFFGGRNPHGFNGVEAFNYMNKTNQLNGKGVANRTYRSWIESYQAQYAAQVLEAQLVYLQQREAQLSSAVGKAANTMTAPISNATALATVMSAQGAVKLAAHTLLSLSEAVALAAGRAVLPVIAGAAAEVATVFTLALIPSPLGNSDRFPTTVPLGDLYTPDGNLHALAAAKGEVDLPVRLSTRVDERGTTLYAVATGAGSVPSKVKVRAASYDAARDRYSFTSEGTPSLNLVWTPIVNPGDASTTRPQEEIASPDYTGPVVAPVDPYVEIFPGVDEGSFDDYVIVFPADSGLEPIYVMFKDRRDEPGVASGMGQFVVGPWLPMAAQQGAPIPSVIADKLRGRNFSSFDSFRKAFWVVVSNEQKLARNFSSYQILRMKKGLSPFVDTSEQVGGRRVFELHHVEYIAKGGAVYDLDNLRILTPKSHIETHKERQE